MMSENKRRTWNRFDIEVKVTELIVRGRFNSQRGGFFFYICLSNEKLKDMSKFLIDNVEINFPFEPYDEQKKYMKKVIECISQRKVGVLESPTGTGKTLSLLCSTLSWLNQNRQDIDINTPHLTDEPSNEETSDLASLLNQKNLFPRVIYASRTHSQLSKAMSELQKTAFRNFKVTILGSRDQMCIHPQVMKEPNLTLKNALCAMHMKVKSCHFGNNVEKARKEKDIFPEGIIDIEDLITKSKKINCCPYYLARELQANADMVFMPYNYLFDYQIRKALKISLNNAIIILDEAHNIDKVCEEASSVSIKSSDIALAITDITKEMQAIYEDSQNGYFLAEREYSNDQLCFVKEKLTALEKLVDDFPVTKDNSITKSGVYIFEILQNAGIDFNVAGELSSLLSMISDFLSNVSDANNRRGGSLKKFADDLDVIYSTIKDANVLSADKDFRVHIEEETFKNLMTGNKNTFKKSTTTGKVVNYWCFNPGYSLNSTVKDEVRSVILTSGTLSPISSYTKEMALQNPVTVECLHIVSDDQVLVVKVDTGPRKVLLKCTYANRQNLDYWHEFGLTLQNFFRILPDGVLIFFPGYATLNVAIKMWRESGLWDKLTSLKPIFIEPQNKSELQEVCREYYKAIDTGSGRGAVFLGVCRGKISEGLDFSDEYGRAVIVVGLPYPPLFDPKVKLKKQYIDNNKKSPDDMTGETWYLLEATKAVNQAIGRVIRHNKDYGAIILCDAQFNNPKIVQNLSKWVQKKIVKAKSFGDSVGLLRSFYRKNKSSMPSPLKASQSEFSQPSFANVNYNDKRSDLNCLETYLSKLQTNMTKFNEPQPGTSSGASTSNPRSHLSHQNNYIGNLPKQLNTISKILDHYEKACNFTLANHSSSIKSCLASIDADENVSFNTVNSSFSLFNYDTLKNEDLFSILGKVFTEFNEKNQTLPPLPCSIFDGEDKSNSPEKNKSIFDSEETLLGNANKSELVLLINRLHKLNKYLTDNKKKFTLEDDDLNFSLGDSVLPAKRRKIKLDPVKIDDIELPGSDERSRAREKRLNETKNFLLELKVLLEPSSYYSLVNTIKKFNSKDQFEEAVNFLKALFPLEDAEFREIFRRSHLLFAGVWEKEFLEYCRSNNI